MRQDAGGHRKRFEVYYWPFRVFSEWLSVLLWELAEGSSHLGQRS